MVGDAASNFDCRNLFCPSCHLVCAQPNLLACDSVRHLLFLSNTRSVSVIYNFKIPLLLSLGALGALSFHLLISRQLSVFWHPSLKWLFIFWALVIIGIVFASARDIAITVFKNTYWKIIVMTLAITWLITTPKQLAQMSKAIIVAGLLVGLVALYNATNGIDIVEGTRVSIGRSFGSVLGDPNDLALVLMFPSPLR